MESPTAPQTPPTLRTTCKIAIIGRGIIGLITAIGLLDRGINVKIYERSSKFTKQAQRQMGTPLFGILMGLGSMLMGVSQGGRFQRIGRIIGGCLRAKFLESLGREVPQGVVEFGKVLDGVEDRTGDGEGGNVVLRFRDGVVVEVDAVIGCDGLKSRTRRIMLGESDPAAYPGFTHTVAYRALLPTDGALAAMGEDKGYSHCLHVGPGGYTVTYPVANNTLVNMILFCKMPEDWPDSNKQLETCYRSTAQKAMKCRKADIRTVIDFLPERPNKWAIFDTSSDYVYIRLCLYSRRRSARDHAVSGVGSGNGC
ncbi:uncharacterized protein BDV17DRAFT_288036 [Aspergillus undulatus]|uniref:uncharacterized protein n=1 Tax=Aspergillus undulatus TaxID=1810928 RepID=UPI003CCE3E7C